MPLPLHIFEPRYRLMVGECIRQSQPFGVVLIRSGNEVGPGAEVHSTGTSAIITHARRYEDGRMDILTVGHRRFRLLETRSEKPYLTGLIEDYPLETAPDPCIPQVIGQIRPLVRKYSDIFAALGEERIEELPEDPESLAFMTAVALNVPTEDKQRLLELPDLVSLLRTEQHMLAREAMILRHLLENGPRWRDDARMFSPN
jgi:Lon protease-like protein